MRRFRTIGALAVMCLPMQDLVAQTDSPAPQNGVMLMNRIGPSASTLYVANANWGLRILNLEDRSVTVLTTEYDNLPFWSPDGALVAFTRKHDGNNFDIYTIRPDGSDLRQLTTTPANDAHAVWTADSKYLLWNSGMYGFKDEATLYDNTFQPYGAIFIMKADGTNKRQLTDRPWEDGMPRFVSKVP